MKEDKNIERFQNDYSKTMNEKRRRKIKELKKTVVKEVKTAMSFQCHLKICNGNNEWGRYDKVMEL